MSSRRAIYVLSCFAAVVVSAAVAVQVLRAQERVETLAMAHAARLAAVVAQAGQAAHDAPRVMDAALAEHMAAEATLLLEMADLAASARVSDRDVGRRLDAVATRTALKTLWWTDSKGNIRARGGRPDDNGEASSSAPQLWPPFAQALAQPGAPVVQGAQQSEEDGRVFRMAAVVAADGRSGAAVGADGARVAELARLLGVDGMIDGMLAGQAADSLWLLDKDGRVLAQGAVVTRAGGAFADPDPVAAALARKVTEAGRADALVERGGGVDGVFAAAPMADRQGRRLGAALIRLPLDGRRAAERDAAAVAAAAAVLLLLAGFIAGRLAGD